VDHRWSRDAIVAVLSLGLMSVVAAQDARLTLPLDTGWRFQQASGPVGVEARAFDDTGWTSVDVPHTWNRLGNDGIERSPLSNNVQGSRTMCRGWAGTGCISELRRSLPAADIFCSSTQSAPLRTFG